MILNQPHLEGAVAAFVDQTDQRNSFYFNFLLAAAALCSLTGLSFGVPAVAWYRRTREKQRVEKLLEDAQIKLSSVIADIFGVSGRQML